MGSIMVRLSKPLLHCLVALVATLLLAVPAVAGAVTITSAVCAQQATNVLRYDCTVTTDTRARVWIDFCEGVGCSFDRESESSFLVTTHEVTLWNLLPSTTYSWQAHAHDRLGADTDGTYTFTTQGLNDANFDGTDDVDLSTIVMTPTFSATASPTVENVLMEFGCGESGSMESDYLIIANTEGEIVWYQDVSEATGKRPATIGGFTVGRGVNRIHALVDKEYIVEYDLSGELMGLMCRCDSAGLCSNGAVPDGCFDDYVHHDLMVMDNTLWVITAEEVSYPDTDDCDGDPSTTTLDFITDGVAAFTLDGTQILEWDMSQIYTPWACGQEGYWALQMDGEDWAHANSIWVNQDLEWTISLRFTNMVIQVDGDPASPDFGELVWELAGASSDTTDDWRLWSSSLEPNFSWQHHAWWKRDGRMMLYDNNSMGPIDTRVVEIEFDESTMAAEIVEEYDLGMTCNGQGSAFDMLPSGNVVANCSDDTTTRGIVDGTIFEFESTGHTTVWEMDVSCDATASPAGTRIGPLYRAQVFSFDH